MKIYYKNLKEWKEEGKSINSIVCCDCLDALKELPDNYVDLVLTDPPYNLEWKESIELHGKKAIYGHKVETEKWDNLDIKELYNKLFKEFDRIINKKGSVIIFTRTEYITYAVDEAKKNNFDNKSTIIWHKTNPIPQVRKKNYLSSCESILWVARYDEKRCPFTFNFKSQKDMHNFIEMPLCGGNERTTHPTQKPIKLIRYLLDIHSNKDDLVLDPFIGSGTTAVACKRLNRNFLGFEINPEYCKIAVKRLEQENIQNWL